MFAGGSDIWPSIVAGVLLAMQFAESRSVVHRDLKPSNILLDADGVPRVGDWACSRDSRGDVTMTGNVGTAQYMAPEQYDDHPPHGNKCDVLSFVLILYEIVVGQPVHPPGMRPVTIMRKVLGDIRPDIPPEVDPVVRHLIIEGWSLLPERRPWFAQCFARMEQIQFKIPPDVNAGVVRRFVEQVLAEQSVNR